MNKAGGVSVRGWLLSFFFLVALGVCVKAQIVPADPMVRITSLPLGLDVKDVMAKVSADVSAATGIPQNMVTYFWQTFDAMYCPVVQDEKTDKVIFVDLYVPIFMTDSQIGDVMTQLAVALATHTGIAKEWVFIQTHYPKEGHVFISGKIADDKPPLAPNSPKTVQGE